MELEELELDLDSELFESEFDDEESLDDELSEDELDPESEAFLPLRA